MVSSGICSSAERRHSTRSEPEKRLLTELS